MTTAAYRQVIAAPLRDRLDLFLAAANRLGAPVGNIEKDFWVCWTLNALYRERPAGGPRLLFKGGTSLSKAHGLIQRFSEDIDITVFRDDLDQPASVEELAGLSNRKCRARLDAIRDACRAYITGPLREFLGAQLADDTGGAGRVEIDGAGPDGQTLLVRYPEVEPSDGVYVRPTVRIESGAKSALDPSRSMAIQPYIGQEAAGIDLTVGGVTTIKATRTFWDKVVIAHGLRRWYERRGVLRQEGQRVSRHYYDLHCLIHSPVGKAAVADHGLGVDCVQHARMFFDRSDYDLASATLGTFAVAPTGAMVDALGRETSRNLDPQFHTHSVIANMVQGADGKWRTMANEKLYGSKMLIGALYRSELVREMAKLGYRLEKTHADGRFEIAGVSRQVIEAFSTRRAEIEAAMEGCGLGTPADNQRLTQHAALMTRATRRDVDRTELQEIWQHQAAEPGFDAKAVTADAMERSHEAGKEDGVPGRQADLFDFAPRSPAAEAVTWAVEHLSEREVVFAKTDLLAAALSWKPGSMAIGEAEAAVARLEKAGTLHPCGLPLPGESLTTEPGTAGVPRGGPSPNACAPARTRRAGRP